VVAVVVAYCHRRFFQHRRRFVVNDSATVMKRRMVVTKMTMMVIHCSFCNLMLMVVHRLLGLVGCSGVSG
jgi:hypothetical protein